MAVADCNYEEEVTDRPLEESNGTIWNYAVKSLSVCWTSIIVFMRGERGGNLL